MKEGVMPKISDLCFFPEGEVKVDESSNSVIMISHLPYVKVRVRKDRDRYALRYEVNVLELYPGMWEESWKWLKSLFPVYADLWIYKGYNAYEVEINNMPSKCENLRWICIHPS